MSPNTVYRDRIVFPIQSRFIRRLGSAGAIRYEPRGNLVSVLPKPILDCGPPTLFGSVFNSKAIARPPPLVIEVPGLPSASSLSNLTTPPPRCFIVHQKSGRTRTRSDTARPPPLVVEVPGLPLPSALSQI
ncbi:hypothetical protein PGT21_035278 [Puccinia graminis f. sp. tritici]|uniref:Uncharacterized protein n=1 Tax=Puccinia graminis f. sp. tritici TaxID=56615 RepID=A0A5B0P0L6_PUCGR|nr:hypothetical protein PGT21_035278 [Puccinia graminis f. sp. tritici]